MLLFSEEFCEIFRAKDKTTMKMYTCKKFLKKDGRKVRKAAKNEILILKMWVTLWVSIFHDFVLWWHRHQKLVICFVFFTHFIFIMNFISQTSHFIGNINFFKEKQNKTNLTAHLKKKKGPNFAE